MQKDGLNTMLNATNTTHTRCHAILASEDAQ